MDNLSVERTELVFGLKMKRSIVKMLDFRIAIHISQL